MDARCGTTPCFIFHPEIGMDLTRLDATGAAFTHQMQGDPFPRMIWPSNYSRLGAATMFTLFFAGNDFAPATTVDVVGYDTLNEPGYGWIGHADLHVVDPMVFAGPLPTPFQTMLLGAGYPQQVAVWETTLQGPPAGRNDTPEPGRSVRLARGVRLCLEAEWRLDRRGRRGAAAAAASLRA
jgi:hypothetical protein